MSRLGSSKTDGINSDGEIMAGLKCSGDTRCSQLNFCEVLNCYIVTFDRLIHQIKGRD